MTILRPILLRASRSAWLAHQLQRRRFARRAVQRFMPGETTAHALEATDTLGRDGIGAVLTHLGEGIRSREDAEAVRDHYLALLDDIATRGLDVEISVKPTQLGLEVSRGLFADNLRVLARRAVETGSFVWIDMEESRYVDATLDTFCEVRRDVSSVGVCLQAYLHRTPDDIESLLPLHPAIRLVKGAYREPPEVALARKVDTDRAYVTLATRLLGAPGGTRARGVLGTHDMALIERIRAELERSGADGEPIEVHMLYGIGASHQRTLQRDGTVVRVLVSYGERWFPWYMRRLAERPANLWFLVRNLLP